MMLFMTSIVIVRQVRLVSAVCSGLGLTNKTTSCCSLSLLVIPPHSLCTADRECQRSDLSPIFLSNISPHWALLVTGLR